MLVVYLSAEKIKNYGFQLMCQLVIATSAKKKKKKKKKKSANNANVT